MDRRGSSACGPLTDSFGLVEGRVAKLGAIVVVGWRSLESQANRDQALPPLLDGRRNWALSTDPFGLFGGRVAKVVERHCHHGLSRFRVWAT